MSKKGGSVYVPDAAATAAAQTKSNIDTATANQKLNMVNSYGPDGSVTYQADQSAPGGYSMNTSLSPTQQAIYNQSNQAQQGALGVANQQIGRVGDALGAGLSPQTAGLQYGAQGGAIQGGVNPNSFGDPAVQQQVNAMYGQAQSRLDPQWQQQQTAFDSQMAAQGIAPGSSAYQTAQDNMNRAKTDAYQTAYNSAVGAGQTEQQNLFAQNLGAGQFANAAQNQGYNQNLQNAGINNAATGQAFQQHAYSQQLPINEFNALMSSGQVAMPQGIGYTPAQVANTDVIGANALQSQASQAQAQMQQSGMNSLMGGLFSLGSAAIGPGGMFGKAIAKSDIRAKRDIKKIGERADGLGIYLYRYIKGSAWHIGAMAQEVMQSRPDAVCIDPADGLLMVNYGAL